MKKVLLVDSDPGRAAALIHDLGPVGNRIVTATSGFYALMMLERESPDMTLICPQLDDMSATELCTIIRQDPTARAQRLVLLGSREQASQDTPETGCFDLVVDETSVREVLHQLFVGSGP